MDKCFKDRELLKQEELIFALPTIIKNERYNMFSIYIYRKEYNSLFYFFIFKNNNNFYIIRSHTFRRLQWNGFKNFWDVKFFTISHL